MVAIGVEQGILLAIALSLFRHVRHSYRPHTMMLMPDATGQWVPRPATPGKVTEPGLIVYRFGADLFYANTTALPTRCARSWSRRRRRFIGSSSMPALSPISTIPPRRRCAICSTISTRQEVGMIFGRVNPYLRSDMDRHGITAVLGETRIFATLHEAIAAAGGGAPPA